MTTYIPIVSDLQVPFQDRKAVAAVASLIADLGVASVCVGDLLDGTEISRWTKGTKGEFAGKLAASRDTAVQFLRDLQIRELSRSNHDDRIESYVAKYAPGLASLPELRIESFLRLSETGTRFHRSPYACAPGWLLMHGDEGTLSRVPGRTATALAERAGKSVACGHTHKLGLQHHTQSSSGKVHSILWGMEVGHLMDTTKATYLGGGMFNWSQGIGMLVVDGRDVTPFCLPIRNGRLYWDGKVYRG